MGEIIVQPRRLWLTIVWTAAAIAASCRNVDLTAQHDRSASVASALERGYLKREDGMMCIRGGPLSDESRWQEVMLQ